MIKNRTIAYIGLWVLLLPWLGFSNSSKNILVSLTGGILLYIGNKHYTKSKLLKLTKHDTSSEKEKVEIGKTTESVAKPTFESTTDTNPKPVMEITKKRTIRKTATPKIEEVAPLLIEE